MSGDLSILWKSYKQNEDVYYRDRLINSYGPFIKSIINHIYSKLPKTVDIHDLESYANIGLLDAIKKYDLGRGIKFETYASYRIKGAIIDGIRQQDWLSRSLRSRYKNSEEDKSNISGSSLDYLSADEVENPGYVTAKRDMESESEKFYMYSIDDPNFYSVKVDENASQVENIYDLYASDNFNFAEKLETKLFLKQILMKLSLQERKIVYLYYFKGKNLKEIGKILNISESRVSQINKKILSCLKKEIKKFS